MKENLEKYSEKLPWKLASREAQLAPNPHGNYFRTATFLK